MTSALSRVRIRLRKLLNEFVMDEVRRLSVEVKRLSIEDERIAGVLVEITDAHGNEIQRLSVAFADLQVRHHAQTLELEQMSARYATAAVRLATLESAPPEPRWNSTGRRDTRG